MSVLGFGAQPQSTPCKGICTQSVGDFVCTTCGRTLHETRDWNAMSREQRIEVKALAKARLARIRSGVSAGDESLWVHA
jgi:predicted Fe-S protein YdhL (DUF1289 family)